MKVDHLDIALCHDIEFVDMSQIVEETIPGLQREVKKRQSPIHRCELLRDEGVQASAWQIQFRCATDLQALHVAERQGAGTHSHLRRTGSWPRECGAVFSAVGDRNATPSMASGSA